MARQDKTRQDNTMHEPKDTRHEHKKSMENMKAPQDRPNTRRKHKKTRTVNKERRNQRKMKVFLSLFFHFHSGLITSEKAVPVADIRINQIFPML